MTAKPACRACCDICEANAKRAQSYALEPRRTPFDNLADDIRQSCTHASPPSSEAGKLEYPEGCTPVDIEVLHKANTDLACEVERLKTGLRFYAHGQHWINELHDDQWDTCSGEPQNWHWRENSEDAAEGIEDGGIAQIYLSGKEPDWEDDPPLEHPCEPVMKEIAAAIASEPRQGAGKEEK